MQKGKKIIMASLFLAAIIQIPYFPNSFNVFMCGFSAGVLATLLTITK